MASPQQPTTIGNLPNKLLSNILIRLLSKQLAQLRCISKPWNGLLSHPSFIKSHLDRSVHNNDEILMIFYKGFSFESKPFSAHLTRSPHTELTGFIKLPSIPKSDYPLCGVIGSVNGLICFHNFKSQSEYVIHIWNPSLSALLTLPPYTSASKYDGYIDIIFRFGFDPKTDDYKVVKLASLSSTEDTRFCTVNSWLPVEVYSMRRGSWKIITERFPLFVTRVFDLDEVCVDGHDGHLHWLGYIDEEMLQQTIIAFNLNTENFTEIPFPDCLVDYNILRINTLGVLAGKICLISLISHDDGDIEVWVMDEYGVADSWVKHRRFSRFCCQMNPFGFTLKNEFLYEPHNSYLALYDPIAARVKSFKFKTKASYTGDVKFVQYVDSLVWLVPSDRATSCWNIASLQI
ncbi:F-box protein CPR30-like protein [Tanacetum coccineum]